MGLVSQCHHPCYHALLVRGGTLRDTTEGGVTPRPRARTPHGSTLRDTTGGDVVSRLCDFTGRADTAEGVPTPRKKPWCVFLRDTTLRFRDTT